MPVDRKNAPGLARAVAMAAHAGQVDKAGNAYIEHPRRVATAVAVMALRKRWPDDMRLDAIAAAWLHDVVEDTPVTLETLTRIGFGARVVAAVDALTRREAEGETHAEAVARAAADAVARVVKTCDVRDNLSPGRIGLLDEQTQARLRAKYAYALEVLDAGGAAP